MNLFVDKLSNLDFSYLDFSRGLVGETWLANIELLGELDEQGMVCDFGVVKQLMREWFDEHIDHCLLVPEQNSALNSTKNSHSSRSLQWCSDTFTLFTSGPIQAITAITAEDITPESVAQWCIKQLTPLFPSSVLDIKLTFSTEDIAGPYYHYSHGLKKHGGNCQRIAHGHRSKIEIWKNGTLSLDDMSQWAKRWNDIYIGTRSDIVGESPSTFRFAYTSAQGNFSLELPKSQCYIINSDSTVELIAQHIAQQLKAESPEDRFKVKAYEGLNKGAIVNL